MSSEHHAEMNGATVNANMNSPDDGESASGGKGGSAGKKEKFLPRVRLLLTKEYEKLLATLVEAVEQANCAGLRSAAVDNAWADAFDRLYASISDEFVKPTGKNRIHKFKSKVVDMWAMMEVEIEAGEKSSTNPTYAMAMRQWAVHQSVMKNAETETTKNNGGTNANTPKATSGSGKSDTPGTSHAASLGAARAGPVGNVDLGVMERLSKSVSRLERMMVLNGWAQPKLPSPLNELHYIKEQMPSTKFDHSVRDTYDREIKKYLAAVRTQARLSNSPGYLPGLLDGLDSLKHTEQPQSLLWTITETYDYVLRAYLKLINSANPEYAATARKRKREGTGVVPPTPSDDKEMAHDEEEEEATEEGQEESIKEDDYTEVGVEV